MDDFIDNIQKFTNWREDFYILIINEEVITRKLGGKAEYLIELKAWKNLCGSDIGLKLQKNE